MGDSSGSGTHHVAASNFNNNFLYFDSFGVGSPEKILKLDDNIVYNIQRIQDMDSNFCGNFGLDFVGKR